MVRCPGCGFLSNYYLEEGSKWDIYGNRREDFFRYFCRTCSAESQVIHPEPVSATLILRVSFMGLGLLWIFIYYLTGERFPIPGIAILNILVGFGIAVIGFLVTMRKLK